MSFCKLFVFVFIALTMCMGLASASIPDYIIDNDTVFVDDSNVSLSATPHTISSSGWVYFNLTSKEYSGNIDAAWGFNTSVSKPTRAELYTPHWVNTTSNHEHTFYNVSWYAYSGSGFDYGNVYNTYSYIVEHEVPTWNETTMEPDGSQWIFSNIAFDSFLKINDTTYTIYWHDRHDKYVLWKDFTHTFNYVNYVYEGYDKWYYIKNIPVTAGQNYGVRAWVEVPVSLEKTTGKYYFAVKPSSETIPQAVKNGHLYALDPWWNSSWDYYKTITINQTMVSQNISDDIFPMFINITDPDLASKAQTDGDDIVFLNAANDTQLAHQVVGTFNSTTGHLQAYVNVSDISNVSYINMYYGNAGATNTENLTGVWGVNASGIWLMDEGTGSYANDSSGNGNNGTLENGVTWGGSKFGDGVEFDGVDDYVEISNSYDGLFPNNIPKNMSVEVWFKSSGSQTTKGIVSFGDTVLDGAPSLLIQQSSDTVRVYLLPITGYIYTSGSIGTTWHHIIFSNNGTNDIIFLDGVQVYSSAQGFQNNGHHNSLYCGVGYNGYFSGFINSVRIYNRALSAEEIATRYNNTNSPELFISIGAEQSEAEAGVVPSITDWNNSKTNNNSLEITINTSESINFNATANQTITTWNWYKDNADQSHNFDNITLSWSSDGLKHVIMNATNANGTSNSITWNVTLTAVEEEAPQNVTTVPHQTNVSIDWDDYASADKYSVYELEDGIPYVTTNPTVDGVKDAIYGSAHEFLIYSPNPETPGDYETSYPVRTALGAYFFHEAVDNDDKLGDDDLIYYFDTDNNGLTVDDPAWKITNNIVKKYLWNGTTWQVTGVSSAVGESIGGGSHYPKHELFIPVAELGANWTNGSTVKVLVKREDSALNPDVVSWFPYGNTNYTDTSLWKELVLNQPNTYDLLANVTPSNYTALNLTPFTIYHGAVSAWNGTDESDYTLFDVITDDVPVYNVSGYVFDNSGNTIAGATVWSQNGYVAEITTSDANGYYIGYNFRVGNYSIYANKMGYAQNFTDVYVTENLTNINVTLTRVKCTREMLSNTYNLLLLILGACFILAFPKRGEVTERDTGLNNVLLSFLGTILAIFLAQIIVSGQVVESFAFESQIYDPLQHYLLYLSAVIMFVVFALNIVYYIRQRVDL